MKSPENSYIQNLDKQPPPEVINQSLGLKAEDVVIDFLREHFPDIKVRLSTAKEDSGLDQIEKGERIDTVAYLENKPVMVMQITTTGSSRVKGEKLSQLKENPFVHLDEMKPKDGYIPRILIGLDHARIQSFLHNPDFASHPEILDDIMRGIVNSLNFDLIMTRNPVEQNRVKTLLNLFETKKASQN